jgi:MEDS: MEthanogen/methylotroph, DcmR Sensory domain
MSPPIVPRYHHSVYVYDETEAMVNAVANFVAEGIRVRQPAIVIATPERRGDIVTALYDRLIPCDKEIQAGLLVLVDASDTLQLIMDGDVPDPVRFETAFGAVIEHTQRRQGPGPIRIFGEMVDLLCRRGTPAAALQMETLGNQLAMQYDVCILCAYARTRFNDAETLLDDVCALHSRVVEGRDVPFMKTS